MKDMGRIDIGCDAEICYIKKMNRRATDHFRSIRPEIKKASGQLVHVAVEPFMHIGYFVSTTEHHGDVHRCVQWGWRGCENEGTTGHSLPVVLTYDLCHSGVASLSSLLSLMFGQA